MVECLVWDQDAAGSSPVIPTIGEPPQAVRVLYLLNVNLLFPTFLLLLKLLTAIIKKLGIFCIFILTTSSDYDIIYLALFKLV